MSRLVFPTRSSNPFKFYLMKADFFSENISLNFNESKRLNSSFGVFLTIIVASLSLILCLMFGRDVYQRKNPVISESTLFNENSIIKKNKMLFFFNFRYNEGTIQPDLDKYIDFKLLSLNLSNSVIVGNKYINLEMVPCSDSHFENYANIFAENNIDSENYKDKFQCVDLPDDFQIYNPYGFSNSTLNLFRFIYCDPEKTVCPDDLESFKQQRFIDFKFLDNYVNSYSHEKTINYFINSISIQLNDKFSKRTFLSFTNNVYSSDNGWLFEAVDETHFVSFESKETDISPFTSNILYEIILQSPQISKQYKRSYLKLQDLLAKVGGFINGLIIILKILTIDYFEYSYLLLINNLIFNEKHDHLNNHSNKNSNRLRNKKDEKTQDNLIMKSSNNPNTNDLGVNNCENNLKLNNYINEISQGKIVKVRKNAEIEDKKKYDQQGNIIIIEKSNSYDKSFFPVLKSNSYKNDFVKSINAHDSETVDKTKETKVQKENEKNYYDSNNERKNVGTLLNNNNYNKILRNNENLTNLNNKIISYDRYLNNEELLEKFNMDYYEEISNLNIDHSIWSYIKYRFCYLICFQKMRSKRKPIVNNIKDNIFDFFSLEREIKSKLN